MRSDPSILANFQRAQCVSCIMFSETDDKLTTKRTNQTGRGTPPEALVFCFVSPSLPCVRPLS